MKPQSKNLFLMAGLLASLVFLVNCNSDTARSIKAAMPVKKLDSTKFPPCTGEIMTAITGRQKIVEDLNKKIKEFEGHDLTSAEKTALNTLADNLKNKFNDVLKAIHGLKGAPEGCNSVNSENKKTPYALETMRAENLSLGRRVTKLTGQTNILLSSSEDDEASIIEQQSYTIKKELADLMTRRKVDALYIVAGKVREGNLDAIKALGTDPANEYCYLNSSSEEVSHSEDYRVLKLSSALADDEKSVVTRVILVAEEGYLNSFICSTKPGSDIPKKVRSVFGDLLKLKNGVGSQRELNLED